MLVVVGYFYQNTLSIVFLASFKPKMVLVHCKTQPKERPNTLEKPSDLQRLASCPWKKPIGMSKFEKPETPETCKNGNKGTQVIRSVHIPYMLIMVVESLFSSSFTAAVLIFRTGQQIAKKR